MNGILIIDKPKGITSRDVVNKVIKKVVAVVLSCIILINMVACGSSMGNENTSTSFERNIQAENLVSDVEKQHIDGKVPDEKFINSQLDFYVDIFKNSVKVVRIHFKLSRNVGYCKLLSEIIFNINHNPVDLIGI